MGAWAHGRMGALVGGVAPAQHRLQCDRRSPPRRMRTPAEHAAHTCLHTRRVCERVRLRLCGRVCASDACTALRIGLSRDSRQRPALLSELSTVSTVSTNNPYVRAAGGRKRFECDPRVVYPQKPGKAQ
jgi:hypothetical protein